jgi:hypothetical protein
MDPNLGPDTPKYKGLALHPAKIAAPIPITTKQIQKIIEEEYDAVAICSSRWSDDDDDDIDGEEKFSDDEEHCDTTMT